MTDAEAHYFAPRAHANFLRQITIGADCQTQIAEALSKDEVCA